MYQPVEEEVEVKEAYMTNENEVELPAEEDHKDPIICGFWKAS